jgi:RNA polymerase sigma-70 factor (ECF subfamily)
MRSRRTGALVTESGVATIVLNTPVPAVAAESPPSDEALRLFRAHGDALYRFARVMVREPGDAEDVVQEAFVRLLHHLRCGGDRSNLKSWLFAVTANLSRDHLRRRRRWLAWLPEHERGLRAEPEFETRDPQVLFVAALRLLPQRDRLLLMLKVQGLSYREIAAASGIREVSVGRLLARALARWQRARDALSQG